MTEIKEKHNLCEFVVPIKESTMVGSDFLIKGVAINSTITRNGVKYTSEELSTSAHSLQGRPILKDHTNEIDSIVGKVQDARFDTIIDAVVFEGKIMDKKMQEMIADGRINSVSIGAHVDNVEESEDEEALIPHGIDFVELSLVAVPADPNATFAKAICENFTGKTSLDKSFKEELDKTKLQVDILKFKKDLRRSSK